MWRCVVNCLCFSLVMLCLPLAQARSHLAIWVWEDDARVWLQNQQSAQDGLDWLRRQGMDTIYLYAGSHVDADLLVSRPHSYGRLIEQAHAMGMQVHALLGSGALMTEKYVLPNNRDRAVRMVQRVLDYNQSALVSQRFDGINLDIEPHVIDDWADHRETYIQMWLNISETWMAMKRASGQHIKVGPAIAFWLDGIRVQHAGVLKSASEHLQDIYDHVVLMDYRNHALGGDGIVSHAEQEVAYGKKIGKPVWLGVEFSPNAMAKLTFDGLDPIQTRQELLRVRHAHAQQSSYAGLVFHHYGTFRAWLQRQNALNFRLLPAH